MLDVILYGHDKRGLLTLREKSFASLRELAAFFRSDPSSGWKWAEVQVSAEPGRPRVMHYSADCLRSMVVNSNQRPVAN
jgi:hypothetical protein